VIHQVGVAGYFIDLGVKNPHNSDNYILGIECDGRTYHSAKSARDRDRLRQEVLETMGWKIFRIWSLDWFQDQQGQMQRLLEYLKELCEVKSEIRIQDENSSSDDIKVKEELESKLEEQPSSFVEHSVETKYTNIFEVTRPVQDPAKEESPNTFESFLPWEVKEDQAQFKIPEEAQSLEIILQKEKETPGTWKFKENKDDHPITIYLTKEQVKILGQPESIKVVITAA
jgi:hypothetical protein